MFEELFHRKKVNTDKLCRYGFEAKDGGWTYDTSIMEGAFLLHISVLENGDVNTNLVEKETGEPYVLYKTNASGAFVGAVRGEIETVLARIAEECFESFVFKSEQTLAVIDYVRTAYGDELDFLWERFSDNAVWRRKDNGKWYGIILTISKEKLGLSSEEVAEIIDLRLMPEQMSELVDHERYFPGWHMNKKSWYTMILDGSVPTAEICARIDESYKLAKKK